jgi:tRNA dimethylallyltransferase
MKSIKEGTPVHDGTSLPSNMIIILAGATSVGKSAVSLELSKALPSTEIIIADSVQIYRQLDIGSNKPTADEQAVVKHHLIDIADPSNSFNTADFCEAAVTAIKDMQKREKLPLLVGGATMWLQWLVHGIPDAPKASESIRQRVGDLMDPLEKEGKWEEGLGIVRNYEEKIFEKAQSVTVNEQEERKSSKLTKNDWYRLTRYLEILLEQEEKRDEPGNEIEGKPTEKEESAPASSGDEATTRKEQKTPVLSPSQYDIRCFFLNEERNELYSIIDDRCEAMIEAGLLKESASLILSDVVSSNDVISKSIGYRQAIEYFCQGTVEEVGKNNKTAFLDFLR